MAKFTDGTTDNMIEDLHKPTVVNWRQYNSRVHWYKLCDEYSSLNFHQYYCSLNYILDSKIIFTRK